MVVQDGALKLYSVSQECQKKTVLYLVLFIFFFLFKILLQQSYINFLREAIERARDRNEWRMIVTQF